MSRIRVTFQDGSVNNMLISDFNAFQLSESDIKAINSDYFRHKIEEPKKNSLQRFSNFVYIQRLPAIEKEQQIKPIKKDTFEKEQVIKGPIIEIKQVIKPIKEPSLIKSNKSKGGKREGSGKKSKYQGKTILLRITIPESEKGIIIKLVSDYLSKQ